MQECNDRQSPPLSSERSNNVTDKTTCACVCRLQVLHALEGVGVVVFPELRPALFTSGGTVAGGLGLHPLPGQSGTHQHESKHTLKHRIREQDVLQM